MKKLFENISSKIKSAVFKKAVGVFSHEIQTDLLILQSKAHLLRKKYNISDEDLNEVFSAMKGVYFYTDMTYMNFMHKNEDWNEMFPMEVFDINRAINDIVANFPLYENQSQKIQIESECDFNVKINFILFSNAICNILKNGLFFSSANNENYVKIRTDNSDKKYNRIIISNNGPKIAEQDIGYVFKEYYTTRINGFGMGLFFAKNAINYMNGSICVFNSGDKIGNIKIDKDKIENVNFVISFKKRF